MDEIYFLIRYTPFWSIPVFIISAEFTYLLWLRKKKKWVLMFSIFAILSFICTVFYYINGGPEKSVQKMMNLVWFFTR